MIDGRTASAPNRTYPVLAEPANIVEGEANVVPYVFYLPSIAVENEIIIAPAQTTVVTTPNVPGLQLTVPAGANLRNRDNTPVTRVSITPVPIDRTPTPLPSNVTTAMVYTNQPGGAISDIPMPMVFPNLQGADPGTRAELYAFNHDTVQWYVYGYGRVSADGRLIEPEINPATGQPYGLVDFSWYFPSVAADNPGDPRPCPTNRTSNPVDLATGSKIETMTDVTFGGTRGGLSLTRVYSSDLSASQPGSPPVSGRFGRGTKDNYDVKLSGTFGQGGAGRIILAEERTGRLFSYVRTDTDGAFIFQSTGTISHLGNEIRQLTNGTFEFRSAEGSIMRFDSDGKLIALVDRNGNTTTLSYTGAALTTVTDPVGRSLTFEYQGSVVSKVTDSTGRRWLYSYNSSAPGAQLATVTDPLDNVVSYTYQNGPLVSITDGRGHVVKEISYDSQGRVSEERFPDGGFERYTYLTSGTVVTAASITNSLGRTESKRFNAAGYVIGMTDAMGQNSVIDRDITTNLATSTTGPCGCPQVTSEFDARGNLVSATNQLGQTSHWEYEPAFNRITTTTDQLGRITTFAYDERGNTTSVTNARGETATFTYDSFGQLTAVSGPESRTITMEYDAAGNMSAVTDALNNRSTYEYDAVGRLITATDPLGRHESYTYDAMNHVTTVTDASGALTTYTYDANGNVTSVTDALNHRWTMAYDEKNRPTSTTDPLQRVAQMIYNTKDELISITSPLGRTATYTYDSRGQVVTVTDPLDGILHFTHDSKGNVTSLTDQRGATSNYTYDELSRLVEVRDPLGRFSTLRYDAAGNVIETIDRLGRRVTATYDELNRPATVTYPDAVVSYVYDVLGRTTRIDDSQSGSIEWTYNGGQMVTETTSAGVVHFSYNAAGQISSMTAADALPVNYGYDSAGRLQTISQGTDTFTYSFDAVSRLTSLQRPNGVTTTYDYDSANRLKRLTHANGLQPIEDYRYTYTLDNQVSSITSLAPNQSLPAAKSASAADLANRISQFGPTTYGFDQEGQTTTKTDAQGTTTFQWDSRARLRQVVLPGGQTVDYGYDALGRRTSRTTNGVTTNFLNDGDEVVLDSTNGSDTTSYLKGSGIDHTLKQTSTATGTVYFLQDHLNTTRWLTDTSGNVVTQMQYEAYGESSGNAFTRFGYTGRERDDATGLLYYRARWYDPQQGRFLTEDPAGLLGGPNLYGYVSQDPVNATDPTGLYELDVHYYLTYFLALKTGCFSDEAARQIAEANQKTDENKDTMPGYGNTPKQRLQNELFHGLHPGSHEPYLNYHWNNALAYGDMGNYTGLGIYLHYFQDTYSHAGFTDPKWGHSPRHLDGRDIIPLATHNTDKTAFDVDKAMRMAEDTLKELNRFARKVCGCRGNYDMSWWKTVLNFAEAPGGDFWTSRRYSIEESGNDPSYLENKRQILDLPRRNK
jgi:RHS repeat-associated protein